MSAIKRGQKRSKGDVRRGVARMLANSRVATRAERQRPQESVVRLPSVRVMTPRVPTPAGISYQKARSRFLLSLCPTCVADLTESNTCPKCGRSWSVDDLHEHFPRT